VLKSRQTDRQTKLQTYTTENNTTLAEQKVTSIRCKVNRPYQSLVEKTDPVTRLSCAGTTSTCDEDGCLCIRDWPARAVTWQLVIPPSHVDPPPRPPVILQVQTDTSKKLDAHSAAQCRATEHAYARQNYADLTETNNCRRLQCRYIKRRATVLSHRYPRRRNSYASRVRRHGYGSCRPAGRSAAAGSTSLRDRLSPLRCLGVAVL